MKLFAFKMQKSLDFWVGLRYNGTVKKRQSEYTYEKGFSQWLYIHGAKTKKEKELFRGVTMEINKQLAKELEVQEWQVDAAVKLIDEGNTIPFISRYRKEATGSLND